MQKNRPLSPRPHVRLRSERIALTSYGPVRSPSLILEQPCFYLLLELDKPYVVSFARNAAGLHASERAANVQSKATRLSR
jgi:hypothetical protein